MVTNFQDYFSSELYTMDTYGFSYQIEKPTKILKVKIRIASEIMEEFFE